MLALISTAGLNKLSKETSISQTIRLCNKSHTTIPREELSIADCTAVFVSKDFIRKAYCFSIHFSVVTDFLHMLTNVK